MLQDKRFWCDETTWKAASYRAMSRHNPVYIMQWTNGVKGSWIQNLNGRFWHGFLSAGIAWRSWSKYNKSCRCPKQEKKTWCTSSIFRHVDVSRSNELIGCILRHVDVSRSNELIGFIRHTRGESLVSSLKVNGKLAAPACRWESHWVCLHYWIIALLHCSTAKEGCFYGISHLLQWINKTSRLVLSMHTFFLWIPVAS